MHRGGLFAASLFAVGTLVLGAGLYPSPARADIDAADNGPGSSLLFPYFEVDLDSPDGRNTLLTWHSVTASALLNHVVVWSDLGYPVLTFNVYLTGFDTISVDLRDVLVAGKLPITASAGQDYPDTISPQGPYSQDINFASCGGQLPYASPVLNQDYIADLQSALTGGPAAFLGDRCSGFDHGDRIARGYVTVDTVNQCTEAWPQDAGYLDVSSGALTSQSGLTGEYFLADPAHGLMHQGPAAALESDINDIRTSTPGNYTFYGHLTGWSASDRREPLPTTWAIDTADAADTEVIVWRDPKTLISPFACGSVPAPFPLGQEAALAFDNLERPAPLAAANPFPLVTQRVRLDPPVAGKPGWAYLGLSHGAAIGGPGSDTAAAQAWVSVLQYPESGAGSTGAMAFPLDSGQAALHSHPSP